MHRLAVELESGAAADQDTNDSPLLPGRWRVLYQGKPGTTTSFFSVESWRSYLSGDGPSPCAGAPDVLRPLRQQKRHSVVRVRSVRPHSPESGGRGQVRLHRAGEQRDLDRCLGCALAFATSTI